MALIIFMTKIVRDEVNLPLRWTFVKLKIKWSLISWAMHT